MDRISPLVTFTCFYSFIGVLNALTNTPPGHLTKKKQWDYLGQHVSFIHSVLSIIISLYVYIQEGGIHYLEYTNYSHLIVISHSLGYFFYDMMFAEIFSLHDWAMRTHHLCVLLGGTVMYMAETGGSPATSKKYLVCILITEGSNPFMMLRKIMRSKGLEKTGLYRTIELIFASSFIFLRAFLCTFINYNMWLTHLSLVTKISISITYGVGFFWIYTILTIALNQFTEKNKVVSKMSSILNFIKSNSAIFIIITFLWALVLPPILTQLCGYGFINLKVMGFIFF